MAKVYYLIRRFLLMVNLPLVVILTAACSDELNRELAQEMLENRGYLKKDISVGFPTKWNFSKETWESESGQIVRKLGNSLQGEGLVQIDEKVEGDSIKYGFTLTAKGKEYKEHNARYGSSSPAIRSLSGDALPYTNIYVVIAKARNIKITGVRTLNDAKTEASVEFYLFYEALPFGHVLTRVGLLDSRILLADKEEEKFVLYDDGWRMSD